MGFKSNQVRVIDSTYALSMRILWLELHNVTSEIGFPLFSFFCYLIAAEIFLLIKCRFRESYLTKFVLTLLRWVIHYYMVEFLAMPVVLNSLQNY